MDIGAQDDGVLHPMIEELLRDGKTKTWPQLAKEHGLPTGDAAQKKWERFAKSQKIPHQFGKLEYKPPPIDWSKYDLKRIVTDADDNPQTKTYTKQNHPKPLPDFSGYELEAVTTNPHGGAWLKYKIAKNLGFDPSELKNIVAQASLSKIAKKTWKNNPKKGHTQVVSIGDIHIGMDSTDNVFGHKWHPQKALDRSLLLGKHIDDEAEKIFLIIGGDLNDGQDGKTTRKGHQLPQNLDSRKQIETSVKFCLNCLDSIAAATDSPIEVAFISDSNHGGGVMDYAVGLVLQHICPHRYNGQVTFNLQEDFIATYKVGNLDFIISHGYDEKFMPRGLPRFLGKDHVTFFERVIENRKLAKPVVWRYDQHQYHVVEYPKFTDLMTKAFSTPSSWVSLNFAADDPGGFVLARVDGNRLSVESVGF